MTSNNLTQAFNKIYAENCDSIVRMCYLYLKDYDIAQDAAQETFIKAYRKLGKFNGNSSINTWLSAIAVNTCKNIMRTQSFKRKAVSIEDVSLSAEDRLTQREDEISVSDAIKSLPQDFRAVILLRYYRDLKIKDIASILKVRESTVNYRLLRAKSLLEEKLKEEIS